MKFKRYRDWDDKYVLEYCGYTIKKTYLWSYGNDDLYGFDIYDKFGKVYQFSSGFLGRTKRKYLRILKLLRKNKTL